MRATSLILKIFGLTVITMSTLACGASSSGKEQPAAAQPAPAAQVIAVVNTATWCPTCQENGDRAMQALTAASVDGAVSLVVNDLIDDATATAMVDAFGACAVDVEQVFVDAITAGRDLPAAQEDCLKRAFPDGFVERALILGLSEGAAALEANIELNDTLTAAARECVS